jgi:hypothetical protein
MSAAPLSKLSQADLAAIRPRIEAPPDVDAALAACGSVPDALDLLVKDRRLTEAVKLVSHAMPRREGVWWVCMCARATAAGEMAPADAAALEAAELWVRRPNDENRRAAFARAEEARFGTPEAWACVAAFWAGDSMSPAGQPAVPPEPHLPGLAIAGAIILASVRIKPEKQAERLARFIDSARDIAGGGTGRMPSELG